jgi:tetratricopeptide (TPR) repeat protein
MRRVALNVWAPIAIVIAGCGGQQSNPISGPVGDPTSLLNSAAEHEQAHEYAKCIDEYGRVISAKPSMVSAYLGRAGCRHEQGDFNGAVADYSSAIQLSPKDPKLYVLRGANELAQGDNTRAYADYTKLMTLPVSAPDQFVQAAQGLEAMGFLADARALVELGIRTYDHYWPLHTTRADIEKDLSNQSEALHEFDAALSLARGTDQLWPLEDRGGYYLQLHLYALALADFSKTIVLDPKHYDFFEGRARAKLGLGDLKGAESDFITAISLARGVNPTNTIVLASLLEERGRLYLSERVLDKAREDFTEALTNTPAADKVARGRLLNLIKSTEQ